MYFRLQNLIFKWVADSTLEIGREFFSEFFLKNNIIEIIYYKNKLLANVFTKMS